MVLDSAARTPSTARIVHGPTPARTLVMVGDAAPRHRAQTLETAGAVVVCAGSREGRVDLERMLNELHRRDVRALLVEGGAEVHGAFLAAGLVDRIAAFVAPLLLGGRQAASAIGGSGLPLQDALRLADLSVHFVGADLLVEGDVVRDAA